MTRRTQIKQRIIDPVTEFLQTEASGGLALLVATIVALVLANSAVGDAYAELWERHLTIGPSGGPLDHTLEEWINEGLMTLFFFVVGLEIKRELVLGDLRTPRRALLPVIAALGGMVVPAGLYLALNLGGPDQQGWGVPMATDIAFVVGVLALLERRAPRSLRVFLLTLAIADDIGAILVIALFYSSALSAAWLGIAVLVVLAIALMPYVGFAHPLWYVPAGIALWFAALESGIHATIAGVVLGLLTPTRPVAGRPVLETLEHRLHPVTSYAVIPIFALANAGVRFGGGEISAAFESTVAWGIVLGLVVGKPVGIIAFAGLSVLLGITELRGFSMRHLIGGAALAGIGFTVSLFIAALAFEGDVRATAKIAIFAASITSGLLGALLLLLTTSPGEAELEEAEGG